MKLMDKHKVASYKRLAHWKLSKIQSKPTSRYWLILVLLAAMTLGLMGYGLSASQATARLDNEVSVQVRQGMTAETIGEMLKAKGLFPSVTIFRLYAKAYGMENSLQAGEYIFTKDMPIRKVVAMLSEGDTASRQLMIPEGYTVDQIAALVEKNKLGSAATFKKLAKTYVPYSYMAPAANVTYPAEGYLFPNTYNVSRKATEGQILDLLSKQFDKEVTPQMREQAAAQGLTLRETIILASLVEKEAQKEVDRPVIAAVFLNRLRQNMPLQSCATIQYILGYPKAELSVQDTEIASPYNTYLHPGLPPGPIANPGMASIQAVLNPATTDYLYFVADKNGYHHFSRTYEEHLATIAQVAS